MKGAAITSAAVAFGLGASTTAFLSPHMGAGRTQAPLAQAGAEPAELRGSAASEPARGAAATGLAAAGCVAALAGLVARQSLSAPKKPSKPRQVAMTAFESETGVQAPVGYWDPLGLSADGDVATFKRRRETELKHGRVAMYATMGYITPEFYKWPGYLSPSSGLKFADVPNGLAACSKVPAVGWLQIILFAGAFEAGFGYDAYTRGGEPGNYGWKALTSDDPAVLKRKLNSELANGRLAMMAIIGMFYQDGLTGSAWGDWANYADSPLRAFESELGVQAPVGFWDPAGLSKDGDAAAFKRRRSTEIKHGRVSMLATMGYITPEVAGKFPGYLSPSKGLAFEDIPNGLAAISKVPFVGWLQIVIYCLYVEASGLGFNYIGTEATPGDVGWKPPLLSGFDGEAKTKKLNAEIANGRLAMMAIIGMFFQDGLTGSAWGDWALYTDSPLRAFESELGVQAPLGFWDPLGLSADGDVTSFKRRRSVEIKHGRICMMATMGYITPEVAGKWPGFISKSEGLKFADIPNGLAAISKVPGLGWLQIASWFAFCEIQQGYDADAKAEPGNVGWKPPLLVSADPETRKRRLNAEIANGRLAMMAIIGMFFQDGLTGSAWGDWANYTDSPLRAFESELGVQAPLGFWDPLGLSADGDVTSFKRRRSVEIKHGRICMMATMGYITPEVAGKWPGFISKSEGLKFADIPNGLAAISKVPGLGWLQIASWFAFCEIQQGYDADAKAEPGNVGWKPPLLVSADPETRKRRLNAEIANGRLAMMAIIGMFFQDGLTGSAWGDWANYTDSPLRAFESELGVQPPVGFWDPVGFTKDGDVAAFKRRRETEIKHGRVSMLATMGYITPEVVGKFPGELSPSLGVKYADIPNGLAALSKVPGPGWLQIVAYCLYCESGPFGYNADPNRKPGELGWRPIGLYSADPQVRQRRLAAEIANGRLAMMAIIGMFFQDGLTGSAWGDWANYTDSPLRAFESELGVQAPVGFWDPAGYCKDGDADNFTRRRVTEIKHGRVSMIACIGYIVPEYFRFPGDCAPSQGLAFSGIPNGLAALGKVPAVGWAQMFLFAGMIDFGYLQYDPSRGPGDYKNAGVFGVLNGGGWGPMQNAEARKTKLNAELANGRLAMMAIIGMFFQDGLTGSAWGDWALYTDSPLRAFESELGVQAPTGFWDPLGYTNDGSVENFQRRRSTEIKHGRVAMYATMGYIFPEYVRFPGLLSPSAGLKFADVPNGLAALSKVPAAGWLQIFLFIGTYEVAYAEKPGEPGNFGKGNFGLFGGVADSAKRTRGLNSEIANGRLAMMAIIGMFYQDGLTGSAWGDWDLYTASPLRAFENELGVQAPLGFWDPIGYTADGDEAAFKRRRATELKHGRISMLAAMGYITPELGFKFSGYLSPSMGLKFADVPNGLKAVSVVPALGWAQIIAYMAFCEVSQDQKPGTKAWAGDFGFKVLTSSDPETLKKKLSAEIANGRLAMMAIIGMFFQDGLTGSPWGDWALYTDSPLRAFESETGVQPPVGFWDPLGLSGDGSAFNFSRRREVELKHGRVSMFATIGYIVPEYYKLPGFLSPSYGIQFAEVPNGLGALSKVPALGWLQIILLAGVTEVQIYKDTVNGEPGNYGAGFLGCKSIGLTSPGFADPEVRKAKLNAELANGRLAMMAIIGMFFQDGLTGSAWGDWALYTDSPLR
ncbi:unnamed protein product [Prorocentrum cordatum]|uniref:Uncharacterized protein n=2 Tax=Prorocentrum cordatum TaxID=2364126 RepID=A0ABN9RFI6_9DINO|nr:unnamed protein product [Polarella glacialis]